MLDENQIDDEEEEAEANPVQNALQVVGSIAKYQRGDSFDIGNPIQGSNQVIDVPNNNLPMQEHDYISILQNPSQLMGMFNVTDEQAQNLKSMMIGGGTAGIHKLLSKHIGDEPSAILGAVVSSLLAKKIIRR